MTGGITLLPNSQYGKDKNSGIGITSNQIAAFTDIFLLAQYDDPTPIPYFHKEMWDMCCSSNKRVVMAAPRGHAKSTAITHAFVLTTVLFKAKKYVIIISDTEPQASMFLMSIKAELEHNIPLKEFFGIKEVIRDTMTDIIVEFKDGDQFRISAFGSEQKVRGRKWHNRRPDLIVCDDLENDEMVESEDRREKLRNWFFKALLPCLSKTGHVRVVGTILHLDAILYRLMDNKSWYSILYKAHAGFADFSNLLWSEMWDTERLKSERQNYIDQGFPEGYSQEYLNNPIDQSDAYFRKDDFQAMDETQKTLNKIYYAGIDFAISDADRAAYTAIVVGGMDEFGRLHIVDVIRFRGGTDRIIDEMIGAQRRWDIDMWKAEQGAIQKALMGELYRRMQEDQCYMNINLAVPTKDKRSRARSIQGRYRAGAVYHNVDTTWYAPYEIELIQFPKGRYMDQVDAVAWLGLCVHELSNAPTEEEIEKQQRSEAEEELAIDYGGMNELTGY